MVYLRTHRQVLLHDAGGLAKLDRHAQVIGGRRLSRRRSLKRRRTKSTTYSRLARTASQTQGSSVTPAMFFHKCARSVKDPISMVRCLTQCVSNLKTTCCCTHYVPTYRQKQALAKKVLIGHSAPMSSPKVVSPKNRSTTTCRVASHASPDRTTGRCSWTEQQTLQFRRCAAASYHLNGMCVPSCLYSDSHILLTPPEQMTAGSTSW